MGHYPFEWQVEEICAEEFNHFQNQFSQIIHQLIPFADGPVTFLDSAIDSGEGLHELNKPRKWLHYIKRVLRLQRSVLVPKKTVLFLPLWGNGSIVGIAVLEGLRVLHI